MRGYPTWTAHSPPRATSWVCPPTHAVIGKYRQAADTTTTDTHQRLIADILTRYRALLMLSTIQAKGDSANEKPEAIAVVGISMKMEFDGLVRFPLHLLFSL
jgi:hypothetical protein